MLNINNNSKATQMMEIAKVRGFVKNFTMSLDTLTKVKHVFTSKESVSVTSIEISATNNDKRRRSVSIDVINMDNSCFNEESIVGAVTKYVLVDGVKKAYELYTDDYVQFTIDPKIIDEFKSSIFYSAETGGVFVKATDRFGGYINVSNNSNVKKLPLGTVEYDPRVSIVTAGTLKKSCFYCHKVTIESYIDFMNKRMNGAFTKVAENKVFNNASEVMKFLTRPGIGITGQNPIFELESFAVVEDISGYKNLKGLKKMDGLVPFNANTIKDNFSLNTLADAIGFHFQFRTNKEIVSKVQGMQHYSLKTS